MKVKSSSKSSERTKRKLFQASRKLFAAYGFSGTSISQIAAEAGIRPSLIYYHVKNKEELWRETKKYIYEESAGNRAILKLTEIKNLEDFLLIFIEFRLVAYKKNPDLLRILLWQMLELKGEHLLGHADNGFEEWIMIIKKLQQRGEICPQSSPLLVLIIILNLTSGPWISQLIKVKEEPELIESYTKNIKALSQHILKSFPISEES